MFPPYSLRLRERAGAFPVFLCVTLLALLTSTTKAQAVPAFAAQTGEPCQTCHVGGFGPQLTPFGRNFKMNGYTLRSAPLNVPISAMAVASYLHTQAPQDPTPG